AAKQNEVVIERRCRVEHDFSTNTVRYIDMATDEVFDTEPFAAGPLFEPKPGSTGPGHAPEVPAAAGGSKGDPAPGGGQPPPGDPGAPPAPPRPGRAGRGKEGRPAGRRSRGRVAGGGRREGGEGRAHSPHRRQGRPHGAGVRDPHDRGPPRDRRRGR